jgi:putative transposase
VACRPRFLLPVRVLSSRFRRLYLRYLDRAYAAGKLRFHGQIQHLSRPASFARYLAPLRKTKWVVYAKPPFGGPERVLDYLGRYTHRVAISNHRLQQLQDGRVTFAYKDYKDEQQEKLMTLSARRVSAALFAACTTGGLPADSPLWSFQQPASCGKPGSLPRTPRCFGSCGTATTGLLRALPATDRTGSVAMPAVQQRSDAADRRSLGECRNRRMGQLLSNAISYASTGSGFPVAQVCAEVCLDPVSAAHGVVCIAPQMPFSSASHITNTSCALFSAPSLPIAILSRLSLQCRDLPKYIACRILQRLSTTEF